MFDKVVFEYLVRVSVQMLCCSAWYWLTGWLAGWLVSWGVGHPVTSCMQFGAFKQHCHQLCIEITNGKDVLISAILVTGATSVSPSVLLFEIQNDWPCTLDGGVMHCDPTLTLSCKHGSDPLPSWISHVSRIQQRRQ